MANCLPSEKDHLHLDSLQKQRAEFPNDDDFLSHRSESERIPGIAPDNEHFNHRLVRGQEPESGIHNDLGFTDDELVELELLRDQEIDTLVNHGLVPEEERWNVERRRGFTLSFPEMTLCVVTARRKYLKDLYGFDDLVPDDSDEGNGNGKQKQRYDPFNPDWSKKETDLTDEQKLSFSSVQHQSEVMSSMSGIDPKSIQGNDLANSIIGKTPEDVCAKIPEMFRILHIESVVRSDLAAKFFRRQAQIRDDLEKLQLNILKGSVKRETRLEMGKRANEPQTLINHLVNPDLTFHCTRTDLVPSIVRQGFLKPDEKNVRCGSTYGRGIYSSPDPTFSLVYTGFRHEPTKFNEFASLKLIACATLTGICRYMVREDGWRDQNEPYPGAHCHAANDLLEYVVFDEAQIIPCYVIHLDLGRDAASYISKLSMNPTDYINEYREQRNKAQHAELYDLGFGPGEEKRRKEALMAKARKYFPYGFGAASGSHLKVEAVGEVSEDEEDFGSYQKERLDDAHDDNDIWTMDGDLNFALDSLDGEELDPNSAARDGSEKDEGGDEIAWECDIGPQGRTKFDEYYDARKAKNKKKKTKERL